MLRIFGINCSKAVRVYGGFQKLQITDIFDEQTREIVDVVFLVYEKTIFFQALKYVTKIS